MSISPQFLDEIRNRLTLSDLIGRRVKVTRAGREFKACCPFHHEKTPSFTINDDKQFYHCFGCGAHGDVLKFVMEHDNLPFRDAVEMLANEACLQMPKEDPRAIEQAQKAVDLYDIMTAAAQWFRAQLVQDTANRDVLSYLQGRGLKPETMEAFLVGYAPADREAFVKAMLRQGFAAEDLMALGLVKRSDKSGELYAFFRERVMFPVTDKRGRVIAFGGRILPDHMRPPDRGSGFKPPKYLNSPDNPLFDKGRVLYGADKARLAARDGQPVLVTEGYMDVIACWQAGFRGAVAPMGTALTEGQIESLWKLIPDELKEPILCFDGDNAGQKAAFRAAERLMPLLVPGCSARFAFMPEGEDPDSLIAAQGRGAFSALLKQALPLVDYIWQAHTAQAASRMTPEQRAVIVKKVRLALNDIADEDVRAHYRRDINQRISDKFFAAPLRPTPYQSGGRRKPSFTPAVKPAILPAARGVDLLQQILLAALINHPGLFDCAEEGLSQITFVQPGLQALKGRVLGVLASDPDLSAQALRADLVECGYEKEMRDILSDRLYIHAAFAAPQGDSQGDSPEQDGQTEYDLSDLVAKWREVWGSLQLKRGELAQAKARQEQL